MTKRFRLLCCILLVAAAPLPAQVVGHLPGESPYSDLEGRHIFALYLGYLAGVSDPAGVGPGGGLLTALTYEFDFPSAFFLHTRIGFAPTAERAVLDPLFSGPQRRVGTRNEPMLILDGGLGVSLTGEKAWRGISPRIVGSAGLTSGLDPNYDIGEYRFGSKFSLAAGLNIRGSTGKRWEWRADLTRSVYRMNYPRSYTRAGSTIPEPILARGGQNPWVGQTAIAIGIARTWGR